MTELENVQPGVQAPLNDREQLRASGICDFSYVQEFGGCDRDNSAGNDFSNTTKRFERVTWNEETGNLAFAIGNESLTESPTGNQIAKTSGITFFGYQRTFWSGFA